MTAPGPRASLPVVLVVSLVLWLPALTSLLDGGLTPATAAGRYVGSLVFAAVAVTVLGAALRAGGAAPDAADPTDGSTDSPAAGAPTGDDGVPRRRAEDRIVDAEVDEQVDERLDVDEDAEESAPAR